ncbi:hypothetical protein GH741_20750 [Aquibacillus halophilus]|uniref:Sporulation histidine kinase inhibitor Sda n=1 Tax=Aquibacillus halophilus TaxID=930132 RepID=A0A6A8DHB8_9BACI|nr:hypothetical protein [Aquibacillus halophilus]MRH45074.1 hypothetical protein [Aquibacillus halophilus]
MRGQVYQNLSTTELAGLYIMLKKQIAQKFLSEAMYFELGLIEDAAREKGVNLKNRNASYIIY